MRTWAMNEQCAIIKIGSAYNKKGQNLLRNDSKCMNRYERQLCTPKLKKRNYSKRPERVCPMALNAKMEENGDGSNER